MLMNSVTLENKIDGEPDHILKILTIGDQCVGKTSLLNVISGNTFDYESPATIGIDFHSLYAMAIDDEGIGTRYRLQMWDCSGQNRFQSIVASYYRHAHVILIVYDVTNSYSFHRVSEWKRSLDDVLAPNSYITFLIANKTDSPSTLHEVSTEHGKNLSIDLGFNGFFEVSARTQSNLQSSFKSIISQTNDCVKSGTLSVSTVHLRQTVSLDDDDSVKYNACLHGCAIS